MWYVGLVSQQIKLSIKLGSWNPSSDLLMAAGMNFAQNTQPQVSKKKTTEWVWGHLLTKHLYVWSELCLTTKRDRCRYPCFQKQVSFRLPFVRRDTDSITEGEPPVTRARVLSQASVRWSQVTASTQESCISTLRTITGLPALATEQKKLHCQGHPSPHSSWGAARGGTE